MSRFAVLVNISLVLTLLAIALGAYTRLTDAGLGCPDWPGCYGNLTAPLHDAHLAEIQEKFPDAQIEPHKARNEMLHRYIAGLLGLCVLAIALTSFWLERFRLLSATIFLLVLFQAVLGMWTVTMNLLPLVVLAHLIGGFTLLSLLALLRVNIGWYKISRHGNNKMYAMNAESKLVRLIPFGYFAIAVLITQIMLGGWTSTNYAAVVCYQLPFCEGDWVERFSLQSALSLPLGHETYEYGVLPYEARMSIHVSHRIGAIVTFLVLGFFVFLSWRCAATKEMRRYAAIIAGLLFLQLTLGVLNVVAQVPLLNAVAHNVVAANLLMMTAIFLRQVYLRRTLSSDARVLIPVKKTPRYKFLEDGD